MNVPKLRFKDNNGNNYPQWEKKKLGNIAIFLDSKRKPLEQSERIPGKYPYYGASGIIDYINNYIFDEELILLSEDGANIVDRNYPVCYIATGKYWVNNHAHVLKIKPQYVNKFIAESLERLNYTKYNTGTAQPKLNQDICKNIYINTPSLKEQTKIANFLSTVDKKISNLEDIITTLEKQKKGLLQQIFNQEIRFKDENGNNYPDWEKKKLGDIGSIITGTTPSTKHLEYYSNEYLWVTPTDIIGKDISNTNKKLSKLGLEKGRIIPANSVLVTCIASIGKNAILRTLGSCNQQINAITPTDNYNVDFVYYLICYEENLLHLYAGTGGMEILNKEQFSKISMLFPCLEEQTKIADFLSAFDRKIDNQKAQLEHWKQIKKGLLQQMFV